MSRSLARSLAKDLSTPFLAQHKARFLSLPPSSTFSLFSHSQLVLLSRVFFPCPLPFFFVHLSSQLDFLSFFSRSASLAWLRVATLRSLVGSRAFIQLGFLSIFPLPTSPSLNFILAISLPSSPASFSHSILAEFLATFRPSRRPCLTVSVAALPPAAAAEREIGERISSSSL